MSDITKTPMPVRSNPESPESPSEGHPAPAAPALSADPFFADPLFQDYPLEEWALDAIKWLADDIVCDAAPGWESVDKKERKWKKALELKHRARWGAAWWATRAWLEERNRRPPGRFEADARAQSDAWWAAWRAATGCRPSARVLAVAAEWTRALCFAHDLVAQTQPVRRAASWAVLCRLLHPREQAARLAAAWRVPSNRRMLDTVARSLFDREMRRTPIVMPDSSAEAASSA